MNTSRSTFARIGIGLFSTVLGAVLLLLLGGLLVADQALTRASQEQANIDAAESAALVQEIVARQVEALIGMQGALLATPAERAREYPQLARTFSADRPGLVETWLADSAGRLLNDTIVWAPASAERASARVEARDRETATALSTKKTRVIFTGVPGRNEVIVVRLLGGTARIDGLAGAAYDAQALFAPVVTNAPRMRARLVLRAGGDTVVRSAVHETSRAYATAIAELRPIGAAAPWRVEVAHAQSSQGLRITLWVLGLLAASFLGVGVIRERRQALRVAERSAELERLSSELLRANRMKSEFLANVSHELRTPLNAIVGFVDLLRDGVYGDLSPRQTPPVERIAASATHLRHLVDQVLDIAKIAAGRLEVHAETIVLRPFVLNVASELEPLIGERGLTLSIAVGASLPRVRTDPTHLRQILVNLIGNAIKYTPSGGVAVRARLLGAPAAPGTRRVPPEDPVLVSRSPDRRKIWIALQVVDSGIGIASADQERIFDEFEQVNAGPRGDSMERGTGLGLAISRRLARLLGGDISVESQTGKGSTFTIWLPVSPADLQSESPAARDEVKRASA